MSHHVRAGRLMVYLVMLGVLAWLVFAIAQGTLAVSARSEFDRGMFGGDPSLISYPHAVLEAVFLPLATQSTGSGGARGSYIPPCNLIRYADSRSLFASNYGIEWDWLWAFAFMIPLIAGMPLSLVLLPITRRRCKVQWRHIGRVAVYSAVIALFVWSLIAVEFILSLVLSWRLTDRVIWMRWIGVFGIPIGLVLWWSFAIQNYLRMPRAFLVAPVLLFLTFLVWCLVVGGTIAMIGVE